MEEYQTRKDIDKLYDTVFLDRATNELNLATKDELSSLSERIDNIDINSTTNITINDYHDLVQTVKNFNKKSDDEYTLFRGDCWTINSNFECSVSITSESTSDFSVVGTFRTDSDLVGIYWNSEDLITHDYISYGSRYDYTDVVLEFDYEMSGCRDWNSDYTQTTNPPVITLNMMDGSIYYIVMYQFITDDHVEIDFNNLKIDAGSKYIDENGHEVEVNVETPVPVDNIKSIMLMLKPAIDGGNYNIIANTDFECEVSNISVTNSYICNENIPLEPQHFRLCEGYDDFYDLNPHRICKEMRKLGFVEWVDLYIGASHFYEKKGTIGDVIDVSDFNHTRTEKMTLVKNVPLNKAFRKWLKSYAHELKANGVDNLIISVSMENLQPPVDWRQVDCHNNYAETEWIPSTFFYSPCCDEAVTYMQNVSKACLDIITEENMPPILQMGEAWWWWNTWDEPNQPLCAYDIHTRTKYYNNFGEDIPEYESSWDNYDSDVVAWLNSQLVRYSDKLMDVARTYDDGVYMALFFPPSVMGSDTVPKLIFDTNYIKDAYSPTKLDILQLEDYDWVIKKSPYHEDVYTIGNELGFTNSQLHYYGGFVQHPQNAEEYWKLIEESMIDAVNRGFAEVFVWAGTQVRRDNKFIGHDDYAFIYYLMKKISELFLV